MQNPRSRDPHALIPIVDTIESVAINARAWLVDIWGVIHNGAQPYAEAVNACRSFRSRGGMVLLLSNSPRPADGVSRQLDDIGVSSQAWDAIVTSGDATRHLIRAWGNRPIFHLGPQRDLGLLDRLDVKRVAENDAQGIVCSGLFDDTTETPDDYRKILTEFAHHKLPMICANPDIKVERAGKIIYCAGALAEAYEALGGEVSYGGKPHKPIYDMARDKLKKLSGKDIDLADIVAIGDGVKTDIAGAVAVGIPAIYIASRVHLETNEPLTSDALEAIFIDNDLRPIAAMTGLK